MSRIGKKTISLPKDIKVNITASSVNLESGKGKLAVDIPASIKVEQQEGKLIVTRMNDVKQVRANHGTVRAILANSIEGITKGFKKELEIQGIGFRAQMSGAKLVLNVGLSHPVEFEVPKTVKVSVPKPTSIIVEGIDKSVVGLVAAKIRDIKRPEPYKGKGIRYLNEVVRRKQGKSVTK